MKHVKSLKERFEEKFYITPACWVWTACKTNRGYGRISNKDAKHWELSHRVSYRLYVGEITNSLHVLHTCDNPSCVNPAHLFLGTHTDNMRDRGQKGRWHGGSRDFLTGRFN